MPTSLSRRRLILGFGVAASLTMLPTACSGNRSDDTMSGGTVRFGAITSGGTPVADPHGALFNESDWVRHTAVYDTLTHRDEKGRPVPALAASWQASEDATEWTFTLRDDAVFSDGSAVTAADALYSIGRVVGKSAENGARLGTIDIDRSRAADETTLVLVTTTPDSQLPLALALGSFVVKDGTTDFGTPIGSGPFVLKSLDDQGAVLEPHEKWWGGAPGVDALEIRGFADPQAMAQAVTGGSIDVASGVQPASVKAATSDSVKVDTLSVSECFPLLMRVDTEPFKDNRVREAIKLAVDRPALVEQVYLGYGSVGRDMIRKDGPDVPADVPEVTRDVARAKQLLTEAGHPEGFSTVLHTTTAYPAMVPLATLVKEQLAEAGITVEIEQHTPDTYWTSAYTVEPFTVGYYASSATFAGLVRATVLSSASYSETGWRDEAFDAGYEQAMSTTDEDERNELLAGLHRRMAGEGGWLVWGFGDRLTLYRDTVSGLPSGGEQFDLSRISVGG
ncbi:ABC transporter substrate-binding protein [Propionibacterium australiense]|uniref:Solute-binding protein family 5 domain n=1 Tax=Propionibacterium australiense TaxID=119981 RepID=A0A383S7S3_9ACTN|nr:ABC transporter substrate-binding protein [Propionibacterium australiense]RLP07620.1 ABC transporter substrate-binding protein [Propionibacterium australiense]SYZ33977.1 Solute-binding protein family 5 domain [Propionibacterium australiense]VEH88954.1 Dipeptide-binding protein [Propionibacterium australiense]